MAKIVMQFQYLRSTSGTYLFKQDPKPDGSRPEVGSLYVTKDTFSSGQPLQLAVTLEWREK